MLKVPPWWLERVSNPRPSSQKASTLSVRHHAPQYWWYCDIRLIMERVMTSSRDSCFIHSFIHYGDLYSAPSRLLLRSAPNPCTAKKKSFETRVECVRKNPGEQSL